MTPHPKSGAPALPYAPLRRAEPARDGRPGRGPARPRTVHHGTVVPDHRTEEHQP